MRGGARNCIRAFCLAFLAQSLAITSAVAIETASQSVTNDREGKEQGFGPLLNSGTGLPPNNPMSGAINAVMALGSSSEILYVGAVSGGVWMTGNGTSAFPTWISLTDTFLKQYQIVSLASSPLRPSTIFAGTGSTSSADTFNGIGLGIGVARSLNGGREWETFSQPAMQGRAVNSVVPTKLNGGQTILAATWLNATGVDDTKGGVWRSDDNGKTFTLISGSAGLPPGGVSSLIGDPLNPNVFYAAVPQLCDCNEPGRIYLGIADQNASISWSKIADIIALKNSQRILLSLHSTQRKNILYAFIITWPVNPSSSKVAGRIIRSTIPGHPPSSWVEITDQLGTDNLPLFSHSGKWHGAISADPNPKNADVVYVSGDELETDQEAKLGCDDHYAPVYRFDGARWESVICRGANNTAPHADGRSLTLNSRGDLLFANDGGIARLINPDNNGLRRWAPLVGNLRTAEFRSVALDPVSSTLVGGAQDNGASYQLSSGDFAWCQLLGGDGGDVAVDADQKTHPGKSIRYFSSQSLSCFHRTTWNPNNKLISEEEIALTITSGVGARQRLLDFDKGISFVQPYALNTVDPSRMLIATTYLYESRDRGDSLTNLGCFTEHRFLANTACPSSGVLNSGDNLYDGKPIVYGGRLQEELFPDMFYVGASTSGKGGANGNGAIFHRVQANEQPGRLASYPGGEVVSIAVNSKDYRHVFVSDSQNHIWGSADEGRTWANLTPPSNNENLPIVTKVETGDTSAGSALPTLFAGGLGLSSCVLTLGSGGFNCAWSSIDGNSFKAMITDLRFEPASNRLVVATLGRGAWLFGGWPAGHRLPYFNESSSRRCGKKLTCSDKQD